MAIARCCPDATVHVFDGSDLGKALGDVTAAWVMPGSGDILFAIDKKSTIGPVTANTFDILRCAPGSLGDTTTCTTLDLFWEGALNGLANKLYKIDGFSLGN